MEIIIKTVKRIFLMYYASFLQVHIFIMAISYLTFKFINQFADSSNIDQNFVIFLNGMGVMATFFIMAIEKVNLNKLTSSYSKMTNLFLTKSSISQGRRFFNLIYSITFSSFILLLLQYLLIFLDIKNTLRV